MEARTKNRMNDYELMNAPEQTHTDQHYVSQFLLRGFHRTGKKVHVFDKLTDGSSRFWISDNPSGAELLDQPSRGDSQTVGLQDARDGNVLLNDFLTGV